MQTAQVSLDKHIACQGSRALKERLLSQNLNKTSLKRWFTDYAIHKFTFYHSNCVSCRFVNDIMQKHAYACKQIYHIMRVVATIYTPVALRIWNQIQRQSNPWKVCSALLLQISISSRVRLICCFDRPTIDFLLINIETFCATWGQKGGWRHPLGCSCGWERDQIWVSDGWRRSPFY